MRYSLLLTILFITGCRKQQDLAPTIIIHSPSKLEVFSYGNFIEISATVEDERNIESVQVDIRYGNQIPKLSVINKFPNQRKYELSVSMPIDDIHLSSGKYYIGITASDGEKSRSQYLEIYINGEAKKLEGVLFVSKPSFNYELNMLDTAGNAQFLYSIGNEFLDMESSSYVRQVSVCGTTIESYRILSADDWTVEWEEQPGQNPPYDFYSGIELMYASTFYSGTTTGLKHVRFENGAPLMMANEFATGYQSQEAFRNLGSIYVDEYLPAGNKHYLAEYHFSTGALLGQQLLNFDPKIMIDIASNKFILFGNQTGNGYMTIFNTLDGTFFSPHTLNGVFIDAVNIGLQKYLIALSTGLYSYNSQTNSLILMNSFVPKSMVFEGLSNTIFAIDSTEIRQLKTDGTILNSYPVTNGIKLKLLYNK